MRRHDLPQLTTAPPEPGPQAAGRGPRRKGVAAPYAIPAGCTALLMIGAAAAASHGLVSGRWVLLLAAVVVGSAGLIAEPGATLFLVGAGWLSVAGFSRPPYAQLHVTWRSGALAALVLTGAGLTAMAAGALLRKLAASYTLEDVNFSGSAIRGRLWPPRESGGLDRRRKLAGVALVAVLPVLTAVLVPAQGWLSLSDDLLIYLTCVVAVAVTGGFWPAVAAAVTASMLLNWFFTPPVHTFTIADPQNMLALLLFVTVAVSVSSVVHLAARRAVQAARSREDAAALLALAQTVLGGKDTPAAILAHLVATKGGRAELSERAGGAWVRIASADSAGPGGRPPGTPRDAGPGGRPPGTPRDAGPGGRPPGTPRDAGQDGSGTVRVRAGDDLILTIAGQREPVRPPLLDGFAAQAAAALDRDRLRTQAAQAEALAEGNRMRTALLAAVSHDLRTPLASIKASISTLRQTGVELSEQDEAALLATTEESADRLNELIGNLLDMSRLATGSLQPFLRPASVDELAPLASHEAEAGGRVRLIVPDDLPLVRTDPGLLERVLANLFANAIAHSPAGRPPLMVARPEDGMVFLDVIDFGPGVADGQKSLMFEPFERLDDRGGGTGVGLGLAVARGFLSAMGGSVTALDTPGGGLTMRVRLPVAAGASTTLAADS
ncbi:MAG: sensor histidine kinase [Streptosporangiaceae bacterium]